MMMIQGRAAGARDVEERQLAGQEAADRGLVGGVEHGPAGAALPGRLVAQAQGGEGLAVGLLEVELAQGAPVEAAGRPRQALGVGEGVLDRQPHVRRRQLRQHRAVLELHE